MKNAYVFASAYDSTEHGVIIIAEEDVEKARDFLQTIIPNSDDYEYQFELPLREKINFSHFQVIFSHEDKRFIHTSHK